MSVEILDALVRAEIDRKRSPLNSQGKNRSISASSLQANLSRSPRHFYHERKTGIRKSGKCGKPGHFERVCRENIEEFERR